MNDEQWNEEVSAYMDGEASNSAEVERRLREDPETATRFDAYQALSEGLRGLEAPEVHPAFAKRVIARLEPATKPRGRFHWAMPLAAAAGIALVAALVWPFMPGKTSPETEPDVMAELMAMSDAELDALWSELDAETPPYETALGGDPWSELGWTDYGVAGWVDDPLLDSGDSLDAMIDELSPEEADALKNMMIDYAFGRLDT